MKKLLSVIAAIFLAAVPVWSQRPLDWGDQHNGTYKNPVLNADYSDPDVIRVGNNYYMVASDFHFMGMQVLESDDLVNWHIVSQVYSRFNLPGWDSNQHYGGGSWAPAIRHHNGLFYIYFCTPDEGLFMTTARDARGPWSPLHCVKAVAKWEDPCPFWDDDGQAYLGRSQYGAGPIIIHKMSADGRELLDDGVTVYTGPVAEGTKIMKRRSFTVGQQGHDSYYYLLIPEGGVCCGWQTVLRSRSIYGPYEKRVVLEQGSTAVNGPHQGALVEAADSTWWFLHFQETHPAGRVVHLQPARWKDDWPLIGVDIDGNGIGEPVAVWTKPQGAHGAHGADGTHGAQAPSCSLAPTNHALTINDDFSRRQLSLQWQWNHNPVDTAWSLTRRRGWLTLDALPSPTLKDCRNMLTQKTIGYESQATTRLDCSALLDGDHAGLLCTGKQFMGVGVCRQNGRNMFYIENNGERTLLHGCKQKTVWLRVVIDSRHNSHRFAVSTDGKHFDNVGTAFSLRMGYWKGSRIGLYCYHDQPSSSQSSSQQLSSLQPSSLQPSSQQQQQPLTANGGKAAFHFFNYDVLR